ncbi:MAG: nuclear transport factor 2 family protein [Gemmatimonadota bacterium]
MAPAPDATATDIPRFRLTMRIQLIVGFMLISSAHSAPAQDSTAAVRELVGIERAIGQANIRRDKAYFERVEAAEFLFTGTDGSVTTKAQDVASLDQPPTATLEGYDVDSMTVRVFGETAVVWGRTTLTGHRKDGSAFETRSRFTDTFIRRDGRWQLMAGQSSRIPRPQQPG